MNEWIESLSGWLLRTSVEGTILIAAVLGSELDAGPPSRSPVASDLVDARRPEAANTRLRAGNARTRELAPGRICTGNSGMPTVPVIPETIEFEATTGAPVSEGPESNPVVAGSIHQ